MKVYSINTRYNMFYNNTDFRGVTDGDVPERQNKRKDTAMLIVGAGLTAASVVSAGIISKSTIAKKVSKKGLELREGLLVDSKTGEKFTGSIKANVGKIGFDKIETQIFQDGILTEKLYKTPTGKELEGHFYLDGKECLKVKINYPYGVPIDKAVSTYRYSQDHVAYEHLDKRGFKGQSVFDWARRYLKETGWFK